ncbi:glycogen debranching protein GlgX [Vibrio sp.]|nr:glycogen debranching protein GlgX [Vibrio sp.]
MTNNRTRPYPLGASLNTHGCNFAIHAPKARDIQLALFDDSGRYTTYPLTHQFGSIKHTFIEGITRGQKYGYIIDRCGEPHFVTDPYAKELDTALTYTPPYSSKQSFNMAKCVVTKNDFDWQDSERPYIPREETILFETHVKGVTQQNDGIKESHRGRYLGLVSDEMLAFYKDNNINTIQLLPVAACMHEPHLLNMGMVNYWGYNPFVFMAPDPRYAEKDAVTELKTAIRELHKNGIEVILDVVYNHTAEAGSDGPHFNLRALDDKYYLKHHEHYANYTGCGNTVDLTHLPALTLVMDSLRHWVDEYQVDGFRFDLAATLGREGHNFNPNSALFKAIAQDPSLKRVKLIAEPWDIGPNGYQVGNFPMGWNECNDRLRDITRSFWRGDQGFMKEFATRIMGSRDLYGASNWPHKLTVNYITYHDGFTMQDLVSYKHKHNEANGEENRDGHGDNRSDNYGVEGETTDKAILDVRDRQKRNFMTSLLFAFGMPHILTADVLSHSQKGNNNAYCQDSEISWLNWELDNRATKFKEWLSTMIAARQKHMVPFIKAFSGETRNDNRVFWSKPDGSNLVQEDWNNLCAVALHLGIRKEGDEMFYTVNQTDAPARFALPDKGHEKWRMICDTDSTKMELDITTKEVLIAPKSMAIFYSPSQEELSARNTLMMG